MKSKNSTTRREIGVNAGSHAAESLLDRLLDALDPILDPIFGAIRSAMAWLHNRLSRHRFPRPVVMTVAEFLLDGADPDGVLLIP